MVPQEGPPGVHGQHRLLADVRASGYRRSGNDLARRRLEEDSRHMRVADDAEQRFECGEIGRCLTRGDQIFPNWIERTGMGQGKVADACQLRQ